MINIASMIISLLTLWFVVYANNQTVNISDNQIDKIAKQVADIMPKQQVAANPVVAAAPSAWWWCQPWQWWANPTVAANPTDNLDISKFKDFYNTLWWVKWEKNSEVTVIYFADVECPFCQRHSTAKTLDQLAEKYKGKVNIAYAHFPLWFHPLAPKASESIECAKKIWWFEKWWSFTNTLYEKTQNWWWKPTLEIIKASAESESIDVNKLIACMDSNEMKTKVDEQMKFWQLLWVSWTPWNVIVNNKSGKYTKVSWASPISSFETAVDEILK